MPNEIHIRSAPMPYRKLYTKYSEFWFVWMAHTSNWIKCYLNAEHSLTHERWFCQSYLLLILFSKTVFTSHFVFVCALWKCFFLCHTHENEALSKSLYLIHCSKHIRSMSVDAITIIRSFYEPILNRLLR